QSLQQQQQPPQQVTLGMPSTTGNQQIDFLRQIIGVLLPIINPNAAAILGAIPGTPTTPSTPTTPTMPSTTTPPLGQINGMLGQTIGNLLNGSKTAIGAIGTLLTSLLSTDSVSGMLLEKIPAAAGLSNFAFPIFIALTFWGVLGKFEKFAQGSVPLSSGTTTA